MRSGWDRMRQAGASVGGASAAVLGGVLKRHRTERGKYNKLINRSASGWVRGSLMSAYFFVRQAVGYQGVM